MNKIDNCFVGQKQSDIENIKTYIEQYPLTIVGFNAIASSLVNFLDIQSNNNFKFNVDITRRNSYWYFDIDSRYCSPEEFETVIDKYLKDNKLDDYLIFNKTTSENVYVLTINVP